MFEQSFLRPGPKTRRVWTVAAAFGIEAVGVVAAALIPVVAFETIPAVTMAPPPIVAPPGPPRTPEHVKLVPAPRERGAARPFVQPTSFLPTAARIEDPEPAPIDTGGSWVEGGVPDGISGTSVGGRRVIMPTIDMPPVPVDVGRVTVVKRNDPVIPDKPVTVSKGVMEGRLIHRVVPVYPHLARAARIQGVVYLQAIIGRDGLVRQLQVKGGHPWLAQASVEAVRQWRYQPTTLSGVPVEVLTEVEVKFTLSQ